MPVRDRAAYRQANLAKLREQENARDRSEEKRAYYLANKEYILTRCQGWAEANTDKRALMQHRRRARKQGNGVFLVTTRDWQRLCARWDWQCAYCGAADQLEQEHVIPIARGGRHSIGNLLPACARCNRSKHSKLLVEWRSKKKVA